ncbi:MAG: DNA alkylation repair protein [Bacteroidales bacterium]|jgi:3-methyladenine DNA glycosylase AlkD|nr:DNA alkylation repair protein [Bacteroidales bacterium]MDD4215629.1 DNA alkylation repair protein [Bacteroidales bacterium]
MTKAEQIIEKLRVLGSPENLKGMAHFGIQTEKAFGISLPVLRQMARDYKKDHELALSLWQSGYHEARMLACFIEDYKEVTEQQMETWCHDFDSWDICDQCCNEVFIDTPYVLKKIYEWTVCDEEFVRRAGFAMMACLAVHHKNANDDIFLSFLPVIGSRSDDNRNFVRKAVNWALRQIGKRNMELHANAVKLANELMNSPDKTARWIGRDAYKELTNEKIIDRIKNKKAK